MYVMLSFLWQRKRFVKSKSFSLYVRFIVYMFFIRELKKKQPALLYFPSKTWTVLLLKTTPCRAIPNQTLVCLLVVGIMLKSFIDDNVVAPLHEPAAPERKKLHKSCLCAHTVSTFHTASLYSEKPQPECHIILETLSALCFWMCFLHLHIAAQQGSREDQQFPATTHADADFFDSDL